MTMQAHIAVDYGGGSGRVIAGYYDSDGELVMHEVHRFGNRQIQLGGHLYWDFLSLYEEMLTGLRKAAMNGIEILSIGIDTWGVDFGLIDSKGNLVSNPICYRDESTSPFPALLASLRGGAEAHYAEAGIQVMPINSVYRLMAIALEQPYMTQVADKLLFMPDLFSYFLTGNANVEYSIASTSELINARTKQWNYRLINLLNLPEHLFGNIVMPGNIRGWVTAEVRKQIGVDYEIPVVAVGSHDTASAVYASKAGKETTGLTAFLSSGTWSLLGCVVDEPVLTEQARVAGLTNEGSADGRITLLQNITGLWILQRLMAQWQATNSCASYNELVDLSEASTYSNTFDVDDHCFDNPASMLKAIDEWFEQRGVTPPQSVGDYGHCVMLSLAHRYSKGIAALEQIIGRKITRLNIIGGGSRNRLLNSLTQQESGVEIIAGPVEATAIGNIALQAKAIKTL